MACSEMWYIVINDPKCFLHLLLLFVVVVVVVVVFLGGAASVKREAQRLRFLTCSRPDSQTLNLSQSQRER